MPIKDNAIAWKEGRIWIPIRAFSGLDNNGTDTLSLSQGTPTVEPVGTAEVVGLPMTTADEVCHVLGIPWNLNRDKKVYGRLYFMHAATGADLPIFKFGTKFYGKQEALTEFVAGADKTVTFAAHLCSTTNLSLEVTRWEDLEWEQYMVATDLLAAIHVELDDLGGASADECKLLGVEIAYEIGATKSGARQKTEFLDVLKV
jgi:hypothetical protein